MRARQGEPSWDMTGQGNKRCPRCASSDVSQGLTLRVSSTWYGRGGSPPSSARKVGSQGGRKLKREGGRQRWLDGGRGGVEWE